MVRRSTRVLTTELNSGYTINRKVRIMMDWFAAVVFRRDLASFGSAARPGAAFAKAARHDALLAERRRSDRQQA